MSEVSSCSARDWPPQLLVRLVVAVMSEEAQVIKYRLHLYRREDPELYDELEIMDSRERGRYLRLLVRRGRQAIQYGITALQGTPAMTDQAGIPPATNHEEEDPFEFDPRQFKFTKEVPRQ